MVVNMAEIRFKESRCKGCGLCITACPKKLIVMSDKINETGYSVPWNTDQSQCIGCAMCAVICPDLVIEVYK